MRSILVFLFTLLLLQPVQSHYKARYHVIVDTDGGIDDFRAICMLLASPEIEVIAITVVDGILTPDETAGRVISLLNHFGHQGIPVGLGRQIPGKSGIPEKATTMASSLIWVKEGTLGSSGSQPDSHAVTQDNGRSGSLPSVAGLILESIELEEMPVDIIALGPMTNLAAVLSEDPGIPDQVRKVFWYSDAENAEDFNLALDRPSAGRVLESGFPIDRVHATGKRMENLARFLAGLDTITTRYARAVREFYTDAPPGFADHAMATRFADDCIPIYLLYPEYFNVATTGDHPLRRIAEASADADLAPLLLRVLDSDREDKSIIFSNFPVDPGLFEEDVAAIAPAIIERHGLKEWKIMVMTNEFHEHLGIYSILGAKMGLRAREYFHVGIDELKIITYAGSTPPVSCLNDGLQVSTGATLGHGTITLGEGQVIPKARFTFKDRIIELNIQDDIRRQIKKDVGHGVQTYGLETPQYWDYIRMLALGYWLELSRFEIFNIVEVPGP